MFYERIKKISDNYVNAPSDYAFRLLFCPDDVNIERVTKCMSVYIYIYAREKLKSFKLYYSRYFRRIKTVFASSFVFRTFNFNHWPAFPLKITEKETRRCARYNNVHTRGIVKTVRIIFVPIKSVIVSFALFSP